MTAEPLIIAGSLFLITKVLFSFFGWFFGEEGDTFVRRGLDALWDKLQGPTFRELSHQILARVVRRLRETVGKSKRAVIGLLAAALLVNLFSVVLALPLNTVFIELEYSSAVVMFWSSVWDQDPFMAVGFLIGLPLLCTVFDVASAYVTWVLIRRAAAAKSIIAAFSHLALDIAVAIIACFWAGFAGFFVGQVSLNWRHPLEAVSVAWEFLIDDLILWIVFYGFDSTHSGLVIIGISAAIPTMAYLVLLIVCFFGHFTPGWFHRFISQCIFRITTETTPVFKRLGYLLGGVAAIAGAVAKL